MFHLKEGDFAPDFEVQNQEGQPVRLSDFRGKKVVLFFYPADNTPTCTVEVCNLRDEFADLRAANFELLGISPDSAKTHRSFIGKHGLPFALLADTDLAVANSYGIFGEKTLFGRTYDGIHRTTFLIDEAGKIQRIISDVHSKDHARQILGE